MILENLAEHPAPRISLEQYTIPATTAATILYIACYTYGDIDGKVIFDLGCGTGRLGIGAAILGARRVLGVDIDPVAITLARRNSEIAEVSEVTEWMLCDIRFFSGKCDTVLQNPPFGVHRRGTDVMFLQKALEMGEVIYSLHKSGPDIRNFIRRFVERNNARIDTLIELKLPLKATYPHHKKKYKIISVDLYRIVRRG